MAPSDTVPSTTSEPVDLASTPQSLARAVYARRAEYVRPHRIRVKIGTWNVAACPGTDKDLAGWFVDGYGLDTTLSRLDLDDRGTVETNRPPNPTITRLTKADSDTETDQPPATPTTTDKKADDNAATEPDSTPVQASAAAPAPTDSDAVHLVGGDKIGLYILGLQEIVDLNVARDYMNRMTSDPGPMKKWKDALEAAMPDGYELVAAEQMSGLLLLAYASPEVAPSVSNVSTVSVGTGLFGYLGNKGAVTTRLLLGETTRMVFVNCHLASGAEQAYLDRRLWDVGQILSRTQFEPINLTGENDAEPEKIGDEDFAFWLGDLNFRVDGLPGNDIRRLLQLHTRGEYDLDKRGRKVIAGEEILVVKSPKGKGSCDSDDDTSTIDTTLSSEPSFDDSASSLPDPDDFLPDPSDDPASLQATLDSLLPHDQLRRIIHEKKAFHDGWREGPITFLPSYKYDVGTVSLFDSSEKQRAPSWCDRILYRTRRDKEEYEQKVKDSEEAKKRDAEMTAQGLDHATDDESVLFDYDPDADGEEPPPTGEAGLDYDEYDEDANELEEVVTKEGFTDRIHLDIYTSHQRIISSDHKPIISVFTLDYDAVVPDLKAKVHAEVAKELDRAENEGRPLITVVLDNHDLHAKGETGAVDLGDAVDFGDIGYRSRHTATLTIANTGRVPAKFSFVEKPTIADDSDSDSPPPWLSTSFRRTDEEVGEEQPELGSEVTLEPGETVSGVLEVYVSDISHVRTLNDGRASLEDILVLRVEDGRDHFIPVHASWLPTCFGRSIDELIRIPDGGIRAFIKSRASKGSSIPYDLDVHCAAPKELFKLTEAVEVMTSRAIADANMIEEYLIPADKPGWPFDESAWLFKDTEARESQVLALIEALDNDQPLIDVLPVETPSLYRLEVVAEVMLLFLSGLTDGIITAALWAKIEVAIPHLGGTTARSTAEIEDDKSAVLDMLATAPNHNIAFVFLTATLSKVVSELAPISRSEAEALTVPKPNRRSLSFRRLTGGNAAAEAALARRRARERRVAEVFGKAVCRVGMPAGAKERKAVEEKMRGALEIFVRRPLEDG